MENSTIWLWTTCQKWPCPFSWLRNRRTRIWDGVLILYSQLVRSYRKLNIKAIIIKTNLLWYIFCFCTQVSQSIGLTFSRNKSCGKCWWGQPAILHEGVDGCCWKIQDRTKSSLGHWRWPTIHQRHNDQGAMSESIHSDKCQCLHGVTIP